MKLRKVIQRCCYFIYIFQREHCIFRADCQLWWRKELDNIGIPACLARKVLCVYSTDVLRVQMLSVSKEQEKQVKKIFSN